VEAITRRRRGRQATKPAPSTLIAHIVLPVDIAVIARRAMHGDAESYALMRAIGGWLTLTTESVRGEGPQCINKHCEHEFTGPADPACLAVIVPTDDPDSALATGFCQDCFDRCTEDREDLLKVLVRHARDIWPDVRIVS
jgi:hypothetical protein